MAPFTCSRPRSGQAQPAPQLASPRSPSPRFRTRRPEHRPSPLPLNLPTPTPRVPTATFSRLIGGSRITNTLTTTLCLAPLLGAALGTALAPLLLQHVGTPLYLLSAVPGTIGLLLLIAAWHSLEHTYRDSFYERASRRRTRPPRVSQARRPAGARTPNGGAPAAEGATPLSEGEAPVTGTANAPEAEANGRPSSRGSRASRTLDFGYAAPEPVASSQERR